MGYEPERLNAFEIMMDPSTDENRFQELERVLGNFNIEIYKDHKIQLVMQINKHIIDMIQNGSTQRVSEYLCENTDYSYRHLSKVFKEVTFSSIENFVIFQRIEYAKELAVNKGLTLTEIAFKLNYSSVAHLSRQFKNTTGLTFQEFQNIMNKRNKRQTWV